MKQSETTQTHDLFIETLSPYDFLTTAQRLREEIEKKSWLVSNVYDLKKTLEKHNQTVLPVHVFSLCHPKHSGKLLALDNERIASSAMPCRISVYEKTDGKTYLSRMNTSMVSQSLSGVMREVMSESSKDVEAIIKNVLKTANDL